MSHLIGSVEVGKLADLAFYKPAFFGSKAEMVLKGGMIVRAFMGDANASIPTVQPILSRKMYAASPSALAMSCITFVSALSISTEQIDKYNLRKRVEAVRNCRGLSKRDMRLNDALPKIEVDPETYRVVADGVDCACDPVDALPLTQSALLVSALLCGLLYLKWAPYAIDGVGEGDAAITSGPVGHGSSHDAASRPVKAAFVILTRNSELHQVRASIRQMEDRFNHRFHYPYVFLNDEHFTDEFKELTTSLASGETFYGKVPPSMWSYPTWINVTKADEDRAQLEKSGVPYGGSLSYRHMCRFQSGWFFRHPLLDQFDYYWRVEPGVQYYCDVDYDVFAFMARNQYKYGWTLSLHEYSETIPTLWDTTRRFMEKYPQHIVDRNSKDSLWNFVTEDNGASYNGCHFWSNFEIGSIQFLRSQAYLDYFDFLDRSGGFFYERWGDAPVHSLAVAMFLDKSQVHWFNDIGYKHEPFTHCPTQQEIYKKCHCDASENFDMDGFSCTPRWLDVVQGTV
ncbi:hypothetical protein BZG36_05611 [Bifiguratus adelaidae]|uniref:Urease domain-containing protein n=1 Tax=Bifiguratus adelaidae TaxID=1938954 RepID=A0A261XSR5_9FUNG|nr:hypothetical protein BZG36_05611 [Bifiguratus adelaidae]